MKSVRESIDRELKWTQPRAMERAYELKDGDDLVATLRFRSAFGSLGTGETADGSWTFKRVGFFRPHVTIREADNSREVGVFTNNTWSGGGTLRLSDNRIVTANTSLWRSTYQFATESGEPLLRFRQIGGLIHLSSIVEILKPAAAMTELPWLVGLGWYLVVKLRDDDAAGAGAAAAAAAAG